MTDHVLSECRCPMCSAMREYMEAVQLADRAKRDHVAIQVKHEAARAEVERLTAKSQEMLDARCRRLAAEQEAKSRLLEATMAEARRGAP